MRCIVLRDNLRRAVSITEKATGKSISLPILNYLLMEAEKGKFRVTGTNLDIAISVFVSGKIEEAGAITIPAKILSPFSQQISDEKVILETIEETKLSVKSEEFSSIIQGLKPDEFPIIPKVKQERAITIEGALFKTALEQVIIAAGTSEIQQQYASVLIHYDSSERILKFAATDSHRLAEKRIVSTEFRAEAGEELKILVPARTAQELLKILESSAGEVELFVDQNQILVRLPDIEFYSRLGEGDFPDYSAIIPKSFETSVRVSRKRMLETLRRSGLFSSRIQDVRLKVSPKEGKITLRAEDPSVGEYNAELPARGEGQDLATAFNWRLLYEGIDKMSGSEIFAGFQAGMAPALIRAEDDLSYFYVLAPLRI